MYILFKKNFYISLLWKEQKKTPCLHQQLHIKSHVLKLCSLSIAHSLFCCYPLETKAAAVHRIKTRVKDQVKKNEKKKVSSSLILRSIKLLVGTDSYKFNMCTFLFLQQKEIGEKNIKYMKKKKKFRDEKKNGKMEMNRYGWDILNEITLSKSYYRWKH